jgi:hypothetical protein
MNLIAIRTYGTITEAELAKNLLEAEGVRCMVRKSALNVYAGNAAPAELLVKEADVEKAQEILSDDEIQ